MNINNYLELLVQKQNLNLKDAKSLLDFILKFLLSFIFIINKTMYTSIYSKRAGDTSS